MGNRAKADQRFKSVPILRIFAVKLGRFYNWRVRASSPQRVPAWGAQEYIEHWATAIDSDLQAQNDHGRAG